MANYGFGITAAQINKLLGNDWSEEVRLSCYMAAAIAELPDALAYAKFMSLLNTLGITLATRTKVGKEHYVETFAYGGKVAESLSELDMQKAIANVLWPDMPATVESYKMLSAVTGDALLAMYAKECVNKKSDVNFVLHRICIGQNTIYRICPDGNDVPSLMAEALRYVVRGRPE